VQPAPSAGVERWPVGRLLGAPQNRDPIGLVLRSAWDASSVPTFIQADPYGYKEE